ncbi:MAG: MarR family winged helix-turn-helix transcriptional regulator [Oscillospiraceae bacterium]
MMDNRGIGIRLRMLDNAVRRYMDRHYEGKKEVDNMTCSNGWIIGMLCDAEMSGRVVMQRDLENEFGITRSTASKVLILLEKKGVIARESVSHDARLKKIVLTERSRELAGILRADTRDMENVLTNGFSPEELETFSGFLDRMEKNIESADKGKGVDKLDKNAR